MTRSSGRAPARARLADLMDSRRRDLRLTWDEVATRAGINRETLRQIRNGNGDIRPLSKIGVEDALEWTRGSFDRILDDGDPTPQEAHTPTPDTGPSDELRDADADDDGLQDLIDRARREKAAGDPTLHNMLMRLQGIGEPQHDSNVSDDRRSSENQRAG